MPLYCFQEKNNNFSLPTVFHVANEKKYTVPAVFLVINEKNLLTLPVHLSPPVY